MHKLYLKQCWYLLLALNVNIKLVLDNENWFTILVEREINI